MNRNIRISIRIALIVLILLLGYQNYCYADVIGISISSQIISAFLFMFYTIDFIAILSLYIIEKSISIKIKKLKKNNDAVDKKIEELEKRKDAIKEKNKIWNRIFFVLLVISILLFIYEIVVQSNRHMNPLLYDRGNSNL